MQNNLSFYETFYYDIIDKIIDNNIINNKILIIIDNYFNPFDFFSYTIKKYNIYIDIVIDNIVIYNKIMDNIKGEECEKNIKIYLKLNNISNIIYNKIIIFHIESINFLNNTLDLIINLLDINTLIYIYSSLSNENNDKIDYKNYIRNKIMSYLPYKMGYLISFNTFINQLESNKKYNIKSIRIYKKNNYFLYGDNTVYEITMCVYNL